MNPKVTKSLCPRFHYSSPPWFIKLVLSMCKKIIVIDCFIILFILVAQASSQGAHSNSKWPVSYHSEASFRNRLPSRLHFTWVLNFWILWAKVLLCFEKKNKTLKQKKCKAGLISQPDEERERKKSQMIGRREKWWLREKMAGSRSQKPQVGKTSLCYWRRVGEQSMTQPVYVYVCVTLSVSTKTHL